MHRAFLALCLCLFACPRPKPTPPPDSGRCEVDLEALGHFGNVGTGATAALIDDPSQLIGGEFAQGRLGDFILANDQLRVIVQKPTRTIAPIPYGGSIIDADLKRESAEGRDAFGKLGLIYAFGRTINYTKVEVLNDGNHGGYAVVAATGEDAVLDYLNVNNVLSEFIGNVQLARDPNAPLPFKVTTYYVLSPGENRVRALSAFCNSGAETVSMSVGDLVEQGGVSDIFNPEGCTNGFGAQDCLVDPSSWVGYQADGVAYGYRTYQFAGLKTPAVNAMLYVAGVAAVVAEGENQAGILSWVDATATRRPGAFAVLAGEQRLFLRDFFVGKDLGELSSTMLALDARAKSRLTVTAQDAHGAPAAAARITVRAAASGRMETLLVADAKGLAHVDLPPGNYLVGTASRGTELLPLTSVSLPASGTADVTVSQGASRTLSVSVSDPFLRPLPAKVVVRCVHSPCVNQLIKYRPWFEVEDQPSDMQAIAYAGADGRAIITLPPGEYEVLVSRGMEYSAFPDTYPLHGQAVDLRTADASLSATLAQIVDSTGWMNADLHVHAMASADSSLGNAIRAMSFGAEGVEVLISTDHDVIVDYAPVLEQLQLNTHMASMIGCEVTPFDYGHHNVFPVVKKDEVAGGALDWAGGDGPSLRLGQLYEALRNRDPDVVIQMNHPRGSPGGSLRMLQVDTATGATHADPATFRQEPHPAATSLDTKLYDNNFDSLELMNGTKARTDVLNDWMTFLSRGWLKVGTGASDSHTAYKAVGGYGRTWLKLGIDDPRQFTSAAFTQAMKQRRATFSNGPFMTMTAQKRDPNGQPLGPQIEVGDTVSLSNGDSLELTVDVQAPEWMQFDSIEVHTYAPGRESTNGVSNNTFVPAQAALRKSYVPTALPLEAVPGLNGFSARRVHLRETFTVTATADTWFVAMVRASDACRSLVPLAWDDVECKKEMCTASSDRPFAMTNAILVDADGSGAYDDFPLKPVQPLKVASPRALPAPPRVPSTHEFEVWLKKVLRH